MEKINFEDGQLVSNGYVEIDGTQHTVTEAEYEGSTPLSAHNLNKMQDNIENAMVEKANITDIYSNAKTYTIGSYCIYNNILYKCKTAVENEEFDETKWEETSIAKELENTLEFEVIEEFEFEDEDEE